jgi:hypothetical protein
VKGILWIIHVKVYIPNHRCNVSSGQAFVCHNESAFLRVPAVLGYSVFLHQHSFSDLYMPSRNQCTATSVISVVSMYMVVQDSLMSSNGGRPWMSLHASSGAGTYSSQLLHISYSCSNVRGSDSVKSWRVGSYTVHRSLSRYFKAMPERSCCTSCREHTCIHW